MNPYITGMLWFIIGMMFGRAFQIWGIFDMLQNEIRKRKTKRRDLDNAQGEKSSIDDKKPRDKPSDSSVDFDSLFDDVTDISNMGTIPVH